MIRYAFVSVCTINSSLCVSVALNAAKYYDAVSDKMLCRILSYATEYYFIYTVAQ